MRGLITALGQGVKYREPQFTVDHLVIGAGLYYPPNSLKTRLCIRGRHMLYSYCDEKGIPYKKLGKLVVALPHQKEYLEKLHAHCNAFRYPSSTPQSLLTSAKSPVPTTLITGEEARELEPDLHPDIALALWSPETGILDSHSFMNNLEGDIQASGAGEIVYGTKVVRVDPSSASAGTEQDGWVVQMTTGDAEPDVVLAKTLINASGLASHQVLNHLLPQLTPPQPPIPIYYAKGSYASYRGPGVKNVKSLIYPVPEKGQKHAFHSLGTHLTLDMDGNIRFGPDIEWIEPPLTGGSTQHSERSQDADYWTHHLTPSPDRMQEMHESITSYLPHVALEGLSADYVGIRPKLSPPGGGFQDFTFRVDWSGRWKRGDGRDGVGQQMVTLMGIESPGLTSALDIAEMVVKEVLKDSSRDSGGYYDAMLGIEWLLDTSFGVYDAMRPMCV
ncbi:hypothetical protein FRB99_007316 [Tulasnella sp. 403]|nr:hypothetical protein FRB99_007316 [Tulasnella sp. 403]